MKKEKMITAATERSVYLPPEVTSLDIAVEAGFAATGVIPDPGDDDF